MRTNKSSVVLQWRTQKAKKYVRLYWRSALGSIAILILPMWGALPTCCCSFKHIIIRSIYIINRENI